MEDISKVTLTDVLVTIIGLDLHVIYHVMKTVRVVSSLERMLRISVQNVQGIRSFQIVQSV